MLVFTVKVPFVPAVRTPLKLTRSPTAIHILFRRLKERIYDTEVKDPDYAWFPKFVSQILASRRYDP
jgi:hypothetical protein